jgi:Raf kinase inhibitor-like YbhB/YbcL family protein
MHRPNAAAARRRPVMVAVVVASLLVLVAGACGTSGRELRDPAPDATAPARRPPSAGTRAQSTTTLATVFALTTDAWTPGGEIPVRHTCDGDDVSPPLVLSLIPPGTTELALVVSDQDADDALHWVLAGIDPTTIAIEEGTLPAGAVEATNFAGAIGWAGPCPPSGDGTHTYDFQLYALGRPSQVEPGHAGASAVAAIQAAAIERSLLTGIYER